ncbi:MAG TPA: CBS domain-containing protein [Candidatus Limnocylindrales bacterium]
MSDRARSARRTPVSALVSSLPIEPLLAEPGADPLEVMHRAAAQPQTRLIGVVDDNGVLIGVVPILRLAEAVIARISPETLLADIADLADAARFGHVVESRFIRDVMVRTAAVRPTATADEAFRLMHERHLSGLYVVDDAGRPTGYLDLLELTLAYVEALEADRSGSSGSADTTAVD